MNAINKDHVDEKTISGTCRTESWMLDMPDDLAFGQIWRLP